MNKKIILIFSILTASLSAEEEKTFFTPPSDRKQMTAKSKYIEGLPNVLLIGDSISIGYTPHVIAELKGFANVFRIPRNAGNTERGLKSIQSWLKTNKQMSDKKWDIIHFNWGLHDLCYRNPKSKVQGKRDKINGTQDVPLEQYVKNLEQLVIKLKKTEANLIWASTTLVPTKEAGRFVGDDLKYNTAAQEIMQKHEISINDLHSFSKTIQEQFSGPGNVHFTQEGSKKLGKKVATEIKKQLLTP